MTKQSYLNRQTIIRKRMIKKYEPQIAAAIKHQVDQAIAYVKNKGVTAAQGNLHGDYINPKLQPVLEDLYTTAAKLALQSYKPKIKAFGFDSDFIDEVILYFQKYLLEKVVLPISETTRQEIEEVLNKAIVAGWGVERTVKELEDSDISKQRAQLIVRTETVKATNYTQLHAAENEPYEMQKQWSAIEDNRTRFSHTHAGVDGMAIDLDDIFPNGCAFPGDPNANIREIANCRCTLIYIAKRDLDGNILMKSAPNEISLNNRISIRRAGL